MPVHEVNSNNEVVVFVENLGHINVNALKEIFNEIEVQESIDIENEFDEGRLTVSKYIRKVFEENIVKKMDETMILSENVHDALVWDEGESAGIQNQKNWDGWQMNGPEIMNPYKGVK